MKILISTLLLLLGSYTLHSQIKNSGFEIPRDSTPTLPGSWKIKAIEGFTIYLDNEIKHSGKSSLKLKSDQEVTTKFISFSQIVDFDVKSLKRISVSAYIKTENIIDEAMMWCQIWDKDKNMIGFSNSKMQGAVLTGDNDWKKYKLDFIVNNKAKKINLGGYLSGVGSVWFDDFSIEDLEMSGKPASKEVENYIKEFNKIIVDNAIYNDSLNWDSINKDIDILSKGMNTTADAYVISNYLISKLREAGDNHSLFSTKKQTEEESIENVDGRQPYSKLLENNIGYINVPGFYHLGSDTVSLDTVSYNFANKIQILIRELDSKNNIAGWIVDLRENNGGNMWPMIAGLGPLTGEGVLGHFIIKKKNETKPWFYLKGVSGEQKDEIVKIINPYILKNSNTKIAVLIGPNTGSSGEMTTIAFIGNPNTILFGQASGGFTTVNDVINLSDGSSIALACGTVSDRNNKIYRGSLIPDILVKDNGDNKTLLTAQKWLIEK